MTKRIRRVTCAGALLIGATVVAAASQASAPGQFDAALRATEAPIMLGGVQYPHGIGTLSINELIVDLNGQATRFVAMVGLDDGADVSTGDYADWGGALIYLKPGATERPETWTFPSEAPTPIASGWAAEPRINAPRITGGTPGRPFLFRIPATGEAPLTFAARNLPAGLSLAAATGIITGAIAREGRTVVEVTVTNTRARDASGVLQANEKFPDMKALTASVHAKGLKVGIYSSPGARTCQGLPGSLGHEEIDARTGDLTDVWSNMAAVGFRQSENVKWSKPGHWTDPDMLVIGKVGWGPDIHDTRLTPNEQITHISLWTMQAAPLLIGADMAQFDRFTTDLMTNHEVLEVNQDMLGKAGQRVWQLDRLEVWARPLADGTQAVALFNRGLHAASVTARWSDIGAAGRQEVRDLWRHRDLGVFADRFSTTVPAHGAMLLKVGRQAQR